MSLTRYNSSVNSKSIAGGLKRFPTVMGWFDSDAHALAFGSAYESLLANNAKLTQTKVIRERATAETTEPYTQTDMVDATVIAIYRDPAGTAADVIRKIVIPGLKAAVTVAEITALVLLMFTVDSSGADVNFNVVQSVTMKNVNVVAGGPASEPLMAP